MIPFKVVQFLHAIKDDINVVSTCDDTQPKLNYVIDVLIIFCIFMHFCYWDSIFFASFPITFKTNINCQNLIFSFATKKVHCTLLQKRLIFISFETFKSLYDMTIYFKAFQMLLITKNLNNISSWYPLYTYTDMVYIFPKLKGCIPLCEVTR